MMFRRLLGVLLLVGALGATQVDRAPEAAAEPGSFPVVAFIGDSYAWGSGASTMDVRWTSLVADKMGWLEFNVSEGGTGYLTTFENRPNYYGQLDAITALRPDIVVVSGGQNDQSTLTSNAQQLFAAVRHFYVQLRTRMPRAHIIGIGPSFPGALTADHYAFDQVVSEAVHAVGAQSISLIRPTPVINTAMLEPDHVHVGDAGHAAIAQRVLADLHPV